MCLSLNEKRICQYMTHTRICSELQPANTKIAFSDRSAHWMFPKGSLMTGLPRARRIFPHPVNFMQKAVMLRKCKGKRKEYVMYGWSKNGRSLSIAFDRPTIRWMADISFQKHSVSVSLRTLFLRIHRRLARRTLALAHCCYPHSELARISCYASAMTA